MPRYTFQLIDDNALKRPVEFDSFWVCDSFSKSSLAGVLNNSVETI